MLEYNFYIALEEKKKVNKHHTKRENPSVHFYVSSL